MAELVEIGLHKRRRTNEHRSSVTIRLPTRLYLHAREHLSLAPTLEDALAAGLRSLGVDFSLPHDSEHFGIIEGKDATYKEARDAGIVGESEAKAGV